MVWVFKVVRGPLAPPVNNLIYFENIDSLISLVISEFKAGLAGPEKVGSLFLFLLLQRMSVIINFLLLIMLPCLFSFQSFFPSGLLCLTPEAKKVRPFFTLNYKNLIHVFYFFSSPSSCSVIPCPSTKPVFRWPIEQLCSLECP